MVIRKKLQLCFTFVSQVLYFNVGAEGSANDASIYQASDFFEKLEVTGEIRFPEVSPNDPLQVPYHLVGDDGFTLSKFMMKVI